MSERGAPACCAAAGWVHPTTTHDDTSSSQPASTALAAAAVNLKDFLDAPLSAGAAGAAQNRSQHSSSSRPSWVGCS